MRIVTRYDEPQQERQTESHPWDAQFVCIFASPTSSKEDRILHIFAHEFWPPGPIDTKQAVIGFDAQTHTFWVHAKTEVLAREVLLTGASRLRSLLDLGGQKVAVESPVSAKQIEAVLRRARNKTMKVELVFQPEANLAAVALLHLLQAKAVFLEPGMGDALRVIAFQDCLWGEEGSLKHVNMTMMGKFSIRWFVRRMAGFVRHIKPID